MKLGLSLTIFALVSCSEAAMESGKKLTSQPVSQEGTPTEKPSQAQKTASDQTVAKDPATETPKEISTAVPGGHLNCALDYVGLPASTTEPRYGCRLSLANLNGVRIPAGVKHEVRFYAGDQQVPVTVTDAPAGSLWQWYVSSAAKGPLTAELVVRDADVVVEPMLAVTPGAKVFTFAKTPVEGSSMPWLANAQVSSTRTVNDRYRASSPRGLTFRTAFPKYITINRATGRPTDMVLGFYLDTSGSMKLTCRYKVVPAQPTYYVFTPNTCRQGMADFNPVNVNSNESDLDNTPVNLTLDMPIADMRDGWYTDWAFVGAMRAQAEPPTGTVQTASIREFAMP